MIRNAGSDGEQTFKRSAQDSYRGESEANRRRPFRTRSWATVTFSGDYCTFASGDRERSAGASDNFTPYYDEGLSHAVPLSRMNESSVHLQPLTESRASEEVDRERRGH